jgi:phospholipid transport system substrate-binding protein
MMKRLKTILFCLMIAGVSVVRAETDAAPMLEQAAHQIIDTLKANQSHLKTDPTVIHQAVERYLLPHVDVTGMSRSVLGRNEWNQASAAEKKEFTTAFTQLVVRTYSTPLAEYSGETVKFLPQQASTAGSRFSRVNSVIKRPNGQVIPLSYSLVLKDGSWKVYDLSVEGVSLLQSFRNQFSQALQKSSMKALISQMQHHKVAA